MKLYIAGKIYSKFTYFLHSFLTSPKYDSETFQFRTFSWSAKLGNFALEVWRCRHGATATLQTPSSECPTVLTYALGGLSMNS